MNRKTALLLLLLLGVSLVASAQAAPAAKALPSVVILATGGTIAGAQPKQGVVVVRSSRVGSGIIRRNIELNDDAMGFVAAMELNAQKARVLLRLGLTKTKDPKEIQRMFVEY